MDDIRLEDVPESERLYEIVNGIKVWLPLRSAYASEVANRLVEALFVYAERRSQGEAFIDMPYEIPVGGNTVRRPSVSFVSRQRMVARGPIPYRNEGNPVVPEFVCEVLGIDDRAETIIEKVHEYLRCGVQTVWIVYPIVRTVHVYTVVKAILVIGEADDLDGGDVLPGFRVSVASLFPLQAEDNELPAGLTLRPEFVAGPCQVR
jgi:Uma2 family endonuclease